MRDVDDAAVDQGDESVEGAAVAEVEVFRRHRAFIEWRRRDRPTIEYRAPTDQDRDEFLGHFLQRKVSRGTCGRAHGTTCDHEHVSIRCSSLRHDAAAEPHIVDVVANLLVVTDGGAASLGSGVSVRSAPRAQSARSCGRAQSGSP